MGISRTFLRNQHGTTAIEYGLIVGLIALAIVAAIATIGSAISHKFNAIENKAAGPRNYIQP